MRRTNTEVKEVRIRHTGTERKRAGHRTAKEGCPCPGLGSCLGWGMNEGSLGGGGALAPLLCRVVVSSLPRFRSGLQARDVASLAHRCQHLRP